MHTRIQPGQSLVLDEVDWRTYSRFLRLFAERTSFRLTYDRGVLEIWGSPRGPVRVAYLLGRFVDTLTEELGLTVMAGRSTTYRSRRHRRGLEPDNSYWIANEPQMRGKDVIDLRKDPPPDLCMEVDATRSSLDRMGIYARLCVPEVWRLDDDGLTFNVLQANGTYQGAPQSLSFPMLTPADVMRFLALRAQHDDNEVVRRFRDWVRQNRPSRPTP